MHVLVTRPEPEATAMAARLAALGVSSTLAPLLVIESCPPADLDAGDAAGVVVTSRNALSAIAGHAALARLRDLPMVVVGPGTAAIARRLGFHAIVEGPGSAAALPGLIAACGVRGPLLVLRGARIAFDLSAALQGQGVAAREVIVYRTRPAEALPEPARAALAAGTLDGVVLMSPESAKVFTMLVQDADLTQALPRLTYFCLSPAVAAAAVAQATAKVVVAGQPNLEEMLALIARGASQSTLKL